MFSILHKKKKIMADFFVALPEKKAVRSARLDKLLGYQYADTNIFNLKSNEISKLTENAGRNENPSWSPDGRHLVFSSNRSGKYQLYLVDYDGRNIRQITSAGENKMPKWQRLPK